MANETKKKKTTHKTKQWVKEGGEKNVSSYLGKVGKYQKRRTNKEIPHVSTTQKGQFLAL